MREFTKGNTHYRIFDDVTEAIALCPKAPSSEEFQYVDYWLDKEKFTGYRFSCWQQVLDKVQQSNPQVVQQVQAMIDELEGIEIPQPMIHKRRPRFKEDQGDELDIDRLRSGQGYWRVCQRESTVGSQVKTLVINMSTRVDVAANTVHWRGAAALVLCHLLEAAGYQCEIWAVTSHENVYTNGKGAFHALKLKDAFGAIDIDTMSAVVSSWFYRSVTIALRGRPDSRVTKGAGAAQSIYASDLESAEIDTAQDVDLVIVQDIFSEWAAENLVKRVLGQYAAPHVDEEEYNEPVTAYTPEPYVPPPPLSAGERRRQEAERKREAREYRKWLKAYQKANRET